MAGNTGLVLTLMTCMERCGWMLMIFPVTAVSN